MSSDFSPSSPKGSFTPKSPIFATGEVAHSGNVMHSPFGSFLMYPCILPEVYLEVFQTSISKPLLWILSTLFCLPAGLYQPHLSSGFPNSLSIGLPASGLPPLQTLSRGSALKPASSRCLNLSGATGGSEDLPMAGKAYEAQTTARLSELAPLLSPHPHQPTLSQPC